MDVINLKTNSPTSLWVSSPQRPLPRFGPRISWRRRWWSGEPVPARLWESLLRLITEAAARQTDGQSSYGTMSHLGQQEMELVLKLGLPWGYSGLWVMTPKSCLPSTKLAHPSCVTVPLKCSHHGQNQSAGYILPCQVCRGIKAKCVQLWRCHIFNAKVLAFSSFPVPCHNIQKFLPSPDMKCRDTLICLEGSREAT